MDGVLNPDAISVRQEDKARPGYTPSSTPVQRGGTGQTTPADALNELTEPQDRRYGDFRVVNTRGEMAWFMDPGIRFLDFPFRPDNTSPPPPPPGTIRLYCVLDAATNSILRAMGPSGATADLATLA